MSAESNEVVASLLRAVEESAKLRGLVEDARARAARSRARSRRLRAELGATCRESLRLIDGVRRPR